MQMLEEKKIQDLQNIAASMDCTCNELEKMVLLTEKLSQAYESVCAKKISQPNIS